MIAHQTQQDDVSETFYKVEKLIWSIVHKFADKNGGDREDLFQIASVAFLRAYDGYVSERGAFSTYLTRCVNNALWRAHKRDIRRRRFEIPMADGAYFKYKTMIWEKPTFSLSDYPKDVQIIMNLTIESGVCKKRKGVIPAIRRHLRSIGWTLKRITETFNEVRKAIR